jgi:adenylate cyclase
MKPVVGLHASVFRRGLAANAVGAAVAFVYLAFVSPPQPPPPHDEGPLFLGLAPLYVVVVALIAFIVGRQRFRPIEGWIAEGRPPTERERRLVLGLPSVAATGAAAGWIGAALLFGLATATHHPAVFVAGVVVGILLAGVITTAATFLLVERAVRPVFASALAGEVRPERQTLAARVLRTRPRLLITWALGSGIALVAVPLAFLGRGDETGDELVVSVLFLVVAGLFAGAVLTSVAARSVADPVERLRTALQRVEQGSFDERVTVDDGGEIGLLQAGFNRMVAGLRERERIRDAFGTYVDREVAEHILSEGTDLGGEEVEVTLMFIDVRDFTAYAEESSAREVVRTINRLFERAVPIIHAHDGHVDKFVGDGLLAVFGAPRRCDDHADQALAAALEIEQAVHDEFGDELQIGVGLNSGTVVAGNVGGAGRLEFSVIGDAVNVAARVDAATRETGDTVLLAARTNELLASAPVPLVERPDVALKGKREPVSLYAPDR